MWMEKKLISTSNETANRCRGRCGIRWVFGRVDSLAAACGIFSMPAIGRGSRFPGRTRLGSMRRGYSLIGSRASTSHSGCCEPRTNWPRRLTGIVQNPMRPALVNAQNCDWRSNFFRGALEFQPPPAPARI